MSLPPRTTACFPERSTLYSSKRTIMTPLGVQGVNIGVFTTLVEATDVDSTETVDIF